MHDIYLIKLLYWRLWKYKDYILSIFYILSTEFVYKLEYLKLEIKIIIIYNI